MNEDTIGISSTVKASHIAHELIVGGGVVESLSSAKEPQLINSKQI